MLRDGFQKVWSLHNQGFGRETIFMASAKFFRHVHVFLILSGVPPGIAGRPDMDLNSFDYAKFKDQYGKYSFKLEWTPSPRHLADLQNSGTFMPVRGRHRL